MLPLLLLDALSLFTELLIELESVGSPRSEFTEAEDAIPGALAAASALPPPLPEANPPSERRRLRGVVLDTIFGRVGGWDSSFVLFLVVVDLKMDAPPDSSATVMHPKRQGVAVAGAGELCKIRFCCCTSVPGSTARGRYRAFALLCTTLPKYWVRCVTANVTR